MIRINLIAERKLEKTKKPLFRFESGNEALGNVMMGAVIVLAVLFCGYKYYSMSSNIADLADKITDANLERERLQEQASGIVGKGGDFETNIQGLLSKFFPMKGEGEGG